MNKCRVFTLLIFTCYLLSFPALAQDKVNGDWIDFGIQKEDTVLSLNLSELITSNRSKLFFADYRQNLCVRFSCCLHTLGTEQVFLCKDGKAGEMFADLSIGYDNMAQRIFVEIKDGKGKIHRIFAGDKVKKGVWMDAMVQSVYDKKKMQSHLTFTVHVQDGSKQQTAQLAYPGCVLRYNVGRWVVGHGFPGGYPNSLQVRQGEMKDLAISGCGLKRKEGQNPIFTDCFTADPACTVIGDRIYAYVGEDKASVGGWFTMPHWLCYSSDDMKHWESHGVVLKAGQFAYANPNGAWAGQVVAANGKYYYYVTLDDKSNGKHTIDVAVSDSPTGPFVPARTNGTPLITDDMTLDSHRANADIDPTVFIDDDGTPWMAWGNGDCYMARLKKNMIELDGEIRRVGMRNYSEGPWLFKHKDIYYNVYAADAPGCQPEQIAYSMAPSMEGPWTYGGLLTSHAKYGFTIHPSVNYFQGKWYFFYHDGSYMQKGEPGGDCRRSVCVEEMFFNKDGSIQPIIMLTNE